MTRVEATRLSGLRRVKLASRLAFVPAVGAFVGFRRISELGSFLDPKIQIGADVRHYAHPTVDYRVCRKYGRTLSPNVKTLFLSVTDSAAITLDDVRHEPLRPQPPGFPKTPQPQ